MTHGGSPVRRLSTASSVSKPPHFILTTEWNWYWKDDRGRWLEFGQVGQTCWKNIAVGKTTTTLDVCVLFFYLTVHIVK